MIKVDGVWPWGFKEIPEKYKEHKAYEISMEELAELTKEYDVAFMHIKQTQPSKKEMSRGAKPVPDLFLMALDSPAGKFRMR
jgi:hypothetical protein